MSSFEDLIHSPLPSKSKLYDDNFMEEVDDTDTDVEEEVDEVYGDSEVEEGKDITDDEFEQLVNDIEDEEHLDDKDGDEIPDDIEDDEYDDEEYDEEYDDEYDDEDHHHHHHDHHDHHHHHHDHHHHHHDHHDHDDEYDDEEYDDEYDDEDHHHHHHDHHDHHHDHDHDDEYDEEEYDDEYDDEEETEAEPLTGKADIAADNMMAIAATPLLLNDELTAEEAADFFESVESDIAVEEGLLLEADAMDVFEEGYKFAPANRKYAMTKQARYNQLYELALQIEARNHNDPKYAKLQKAYRIEREIKKGFRQRYHNLATKRARGYLKRLMTSKSPTLKKIGKNVTKGK